MIRASAGRQSKFSGTAFDSPIRYPPGLTQQNLPPKKYTDGAHDRLLIVKVDIGVGFDVGAADKKIHRVAAQKAPFPGIFPIKGALDPVAIILLFLVVNRVILVIFSLPNKGVACE